MGGPIHCTTGRWAVTLRLSSSRSPFNPTAVWQALPPRSMASIPIPMTTASHPTPHQGDTVCIAGDEQLYQVIGVDASRHRCWLRAWPLGRHGSQVFEISLEQVLPKPLHRPGRQA